MTPSYHKILANAATPCQLDKFRTIVLEGGAVPPQSYDATIIQNPLLYFYPNSEDIQGIAALKTPHPDYKQRIFQQAGALDQAVLYPFELGWIVSLPAYRGQGIGKKLSAIVCEENAVNLFATSRIDNFAMIKILQDLGFSQLGHSYSSIRAEYQLSLYVRSGNSTER
jgi:GNAT superfamily N-acetyltransferase